MANVCVVGMGKLGAPLAAVLASRGHTVVGVDRSEDVVAKMGRGEPPVEEPGLEELLSEHPILATTSYDVVADCEITFVVVPTPSVGDGAFTNAYVHDAVVRIGEALKERDGWHLVVITSTVMPGSLEAVIGPDLEKSSGRSIAAGEVGLCYSPEFIALGNVIEGLTSPDLVLIGEADQRSGAVLQALMATVVGPDVAVVRTAPINAELAKLAINTYVTMKMSFANNLAEICEGLAGADAVAVAQAVGLDSRIGDTYLRPAVAYGGPCFPRDTLAYQTVARSSGASADLAWATAHTNQRCRARLVERVVEHASPGETVGILGLAYKPGTSVVEESAGIDLANALVEVGLHVVAYDPAVARKPADLDPSVILVDSAEGVCQSARVVAICTAWPEFVQIAPACFLRPNRVLIDWWGLFDQVQAPADAQVVSVGRGRCS